MKKVLLGICILVLAQTSFAGHHEKNEGSEKTIIGYEIIDGERLDIAAGTAVRFEPGQTREVQLIAMSGARRVFGFNAQIMGDL